MIKAKDWTAEKSVPGVYSVDGDDGYWKDYVVSCFKERVPVADWDFVIKKIHSLKTLDALQDACETISLFGGSSLILVDDPTYKEKSGDGEVLTKILKDTEHTVVFVGVSLPKSLKVKPERIDANRLTLPEVVPEIQKRFPFLKGRAAYTLAEYAGRDMARMVTEGEKLRAYALDRDVTDEDVKKLVANTVENEIYEFTGAVASGNKAGAMTILERFQSKGTASAFLLSALTSQYRRMFYAVCSTGTPAEIATLLGVKEYAIVKAKEAGKKYTKKRLKQNLDMLSAAEYAFKSGVMGEDTALKNAVGKLLQDA